MNEFDKILKDATCDVLVSMFKDDVAHHLVDSCYNYDESEGMDVKKAIGNVRMEQNYWGWNNGRFQGRGAYITFSHFKHFSL